MKSPVHFGEWLQQRRKALDLTQGELADRAGCSVFALRKIESGDRRPSKQLASLLARALEIPSEDQQIFIRVARGELNLERLPIPAPSLAAPASAQARFQPGRVNLPAPPTPLVGRENELTMLESLLADPQCRLLTLVGPGGIGKTRLGIEVATKIQGLFTGGAFFVSLASLSSPGYLIPSIADALGLAFQGQTEPKIQLLNHLRDKQMLLVLDNVEHLLAGVDVFTEMLKASPGLKLLVTSRERLNLQAEWVFEIQGLPVPVGELDGNIEIYGSIELFIQVARRVKASFNLQAEDRPAVVRICQIVEGMPLGIELAAAWIPVLSCVEIAQEIERSLDFLATSMRDVPERQRSLSAVFDHSWRLLSEEEQKVLSRLAIFEGGFTRQAAEQVCEAGLPTLLGLTSKSLVRLKQNGRYDLHEVVRQYAYSHLSADPACEDICDPHSDYYLKLLEDHEKVLKSANQREAIRKLTEEIDNIRAAWAWAIQRDKFPALGRVLRSFTWLCHVVGWLGDGIQQLDSVVQAIRLRSEEVEHQRILGVALALEGLLYFRKGIFDRAMDCYEQSLRMLRPFADPRDLTDPLLYLGLISHLVGDLERGKSLIAECLACAQATGERWYEAYSVFNLGYLASQSGDYSQGTEQMLSGLRIWRALGDPSSIALGLNYVTPTLIHLGRYSEAAANLQESIQLCQQVGERWGLGTAYRTLGMLALAQGDAQQAIQYVQQAMDTFKGYVIGWDIAKSLILLGAADTRLGEFSAARDTFREAVRQALDCHSIPLVLDAVLGLADWHARAGELEWALVLVSHVLEHPSSVHETRESAHQLAAGLKGGLSDVQIQAARNSARELSLSEIASKLLIHSLPDQSPAK